MAGFNSVQFEPDRHDEHRNRKHFRQLFEASVLFALVLQIASPWGTISPDILAVVRVSGTKQRRDTVQRAVEALLA